MFVTQHFHFSRWFHLYHNKLLFRKQSSRHIGERLCLNLKMWSIPRSPAQLVLTFFALGRTRFLVNGGCIHQSEFLVQCRLDAIVSYRFIICQRLKQKTYVYIFGESFRWYRGRICHVTIGIAYWTKPFTITKNLLISNNYDWFGNYWWMKVVDNMYEIGATLFGDLSIRIESSQIKSQRTNTTHKVLHV